MKAIKETVETVKEKVKVLYSTVMELDMYYGNMRVPMNTPKEVTKMADRQTWLNKLKEGFWAKVDAVDYTKDKDGEANSDQVKAQLKQEQANKFLQDEVINVTKEEFAFLTLGEFVTAIRGMVLDNGLTPNNKQVAFMKEWFVKEVKVEEAEEIATEEIN